MSTPAAQPAPGQEHKNYLTKTAPLNRMTVTRGASVLDIEYHHQGAAPHRTFRLPARSTWSPGPHWHEATDEFFKVVQGSVRLVVGGRSRVLTAKDGEIKVNKGVIHDFMRADTGADKAGEEVVLEERCEPGKRKRVADFSRGVCANCGACWDRGRHERDIPPQHPLLGSGKGRNLQPLYEVSQHPHDQSEIRQLRRLPPRAGYQAVDISHLLHLQLHRLDLQPTLLVPRLPARQVLGRSGGKIPATD